MPYLQESWRFAASLGGPVSRTSADIQGSWRQDFQSSCRELVEKRRVSGASKDGKVQDAILCVRGQDLVSPTAMESGDLDGRHTQRRPARATEASTPVVPDSSRKTNRSERYPDILYR